MSVAQCHDWESATPETWQAKAQEMLGYHWKVTIAEMCKVDKVTARRWIDETKEIPPEFETKIHAIYSVWFNQVD